MLRRLSLLGLGAVCGGSCGFDGRQEENLIPIEEPTRDIRIAPGIPISISLRHGLCTNRNTFCLTERPDEQLALAIGDDTIVAAQYEVDAASRVALELTGLRPGQTKLRVNYLDFFGKQQEDEFTVHVSPVARVDWTFGCDSANPEPEFVVAPAFRAMFELQPLDGAGNILLTGDLPLVETYGGFVFEENSIAEDLALIAPSTPGRYALKFIGDDTAPLNFEVYDPNTLLPKITATDDARGTLVYFGYAIPEVEVCGTASASRRAVARVEQGDCRLGTDTIEMVGDIPFALKSKTNAGVSGAGPCLISLTDERGHRAEAWLPTVAPPFIANRTDTRLSPEVLEIADGLSSFDRAEEGPAACRRVENLTNGRCEIVEVGTILVLPGIDCLFDVNWATEVWEPGDGEPIADALLGVGLRAELHTEIRYTTLAGLLTLGVTPPSGLATMMDPSDGVELVEVGCTTTDTQVFALYPSRPGVTHIHLTAENTFGKDDSITVHAQEVARSVFMEPIMTWADTPEGSERAIFVHTAIRGKIQYLSAEGAVLRGLAPLHASSTSAAARASLHPLNDLTWDLFGGYAPSTIELATPVSGDVHKIHVVDETGVATIGGIEPEVEVAVGLPMCFNIDPVDARGLPIQGKPPRRARLRVHGDVEILFTGPPILGCITGESPGVVELEWSWGSDTRTQTVHFVGG